MKSWRENSYRKLILLAAILAGGVSVFAYSGSQQTLRLSANDPQLQIAQDDGAALSSGATVASLVPSVKVNAASSLAGFVAFYNVGGQYLAGNGTFDGRVLSPPTGTFASARARGTDWFSWQPDPAWRQAAVLTWHGGPNAGYVLASRSLSVVEGREASLADRFWVTLSGILVVSLFFWWL